MRLIVVVVLDVIMNKFIDEKKTLTRTNVHYRTGENHRWC